MLLVIGCDQPGFRVGIRITGSRIQVVEMVVAAVPDDEERGAFSFDETTFDSLIVMGRAQSRPYWEGRASH